MIARQSLLRQACAVSSRSPMIRTSAFSSLRSATQEPIKSRFATQCFTRSASEGPSRVAMFHSSVKRDILPPKPQEVEGTANDPVTVPTPHPLEGSYHWLAERTVAVALIPITVAPFLGTSLNPVLDATFCGLLVLHSHMGFSSCITDYFPNKRVPKTRKSLEYVLLLSTVGVAYGLWEFETNDVGLVEGVKRVWKA